MPKKEFQLILNTEQQLGKLYIEIETKEFTVGKILKRLRKIYGIRLEKIATEMDLTLQTLSNYERDTHVPRPNQLEKLCVVYKFNEAVMFEIAGEQVKQLYIKKKTKVLI